MWSATGLVVGHTIAVGIFLTPAEMIGALAAPALTLGLWIVCGALVLAGALTFGELGARYPRAGGLYVYLREAWGERVAFLYGWQSLLVMDPGITAALATGIAQYLVVLWPNAAGFQKLVAIAAIWLLAGLNMAGFTLSTRVLGLLTALKLAALAGIVVVAFTIGDGSWSNMAPFAERRPGAPPLAEALALGLVGVFFSFGGFWEASRVAGEVRDPERTLPLALVLGVACVTLVYVLTSLAFMYLVPIEGATSAVEFARRAGESMLGLAGPPVLSAIVLLSVAPSAMALLMMAPRLYTAMSRDGLFPEVLAALGPDGRTPLRATALLAFLASAFVLAGTLSADRGVLSLHDAGVRGDGGSGPDCHTLTGAGRRPPAGRGCRAGGVRALRFGRRHHRRGGPPDSGACRIRARAAGTSRAPPAHEHVRSYLTKNRHPHHAVHVVAAVGVQHASEALHRIGNIGMARTRIGSVILLASSMNAVQACAESDLGTGVEGVDTPLEQARGVQVVVRDPLEELATGLPQHEVVIERRASVLRVMDVPHTGIH